MLGYDALLIALSVLIPAGLYAVPKLYKRRKKAVKKRVALEARRDETLEQVAATLRELSGDVKCLFDVNNVQLESLEITLRALHGEHLNGDVDEAIRKIRAAKQGLSGRLVSKVGCATIGEGVD
jgi:cell division protein FtsX